MARQSVKSSARALGLVALLAFATAANAQDLFSSLLNSIFKISWTSPVWVAPSPSPVVSPGIWYAKTDPATYRPQQVDWAGLISACRATVQFEKRIGNFWIRASFHDSMSVNMTDCVAGLPSCGGLDASNMLSIEEMTRPENAYDNFTLIASKASKKIASWYGASMADTLAVCAAVSIEEHSKLRVKIIGRAGTANFPVGRIDRLTPTAPGLLPPADVRTPEFSQFFIDRGFLPAQGAALLGSHSLIDEQACDMGPGVAPCVPSGSGTCRDVRMFRWDNHYFQDICSPKIQINPKDPKVVDPADIPVSQMTTAQYTQAKTDETCKFTSDAYRLKALAELSAERSGLIQSVPKTSLFSVDWYPNNTLTKKHWFYTINDAFLGKLCQNTSTTLSSDPTLDSNLKNLRDGMRLFKANQTAWDEILINSYLQMVTTFAQWNSGTTPKYFINGKECSSAWTADSACVLKSGLFSVSCALCSADGGNCHSCCRCRSHFIAGVSYRPSPLRDLTSLLSNTYRWDSKVAAVSYKWLQYSKSFPWVKLG